MSDPRSDRRSDNRSDNRDAAPGSSEGSRAFREEVLANTARLLVLEAVDKLQDKSDQDPGTPARSMSLQQATANLLPSNMMLPSSSSQRSSSSSGLNARNFFWNRKSTCRKRDRKPSKGMQTKKKKSSTWTHTFICLARCNQESIPDSEERMALQLSGLGEEKVSFSLDADHHDIYGELQVVFPQLKDCGGFELLRLPEGGGKVLQVIACPKIGYSVPYLRAVVHHARIYIRPLQKDLDTDDNFDNLNNVPSCSPKETCMSCGVLMAVSAIREHIKLCEGRSEIESVVQSAKLPAPHLPIILSDDDSENDSLLNMALELSKEETSNVALELSKEEASASQQFKPQSLADVVTHLRKDIKTLEFDMVVRRSHVLVDAVNRIKTSTFDPAKYFDVEFVGEPGVDGGGLSREFFRILFQQFSSIYLDSTGCFKHNSVAFQDGIYFSLGQLASMCLVHGGAAIRIFCPSVYSYFCGKKPSDIVVEHDEIPDFVVRDFVRKIMEAPSEEKLQSLLIDNCDLLSERGYSKPLSYVKLTDKASIVQTLSLHEVLLKSLGETQQFLDGLATLNVASALMAHSGLLKQFFCNDPSLNTPLTADIMRKLFTRVIYSDKGSNERQKEEHTYMMFLEYLDKCEKVTIESGTNNSFQEIDEDGNLDFTVKEGKVSLEMILSFFTGAHEIPPLGLPHEPQLNFSAAVRYPTSSTCAIQLTLPTMFWTDIKDSIVQALPSASAWYVGLSWTSAPPKWLPSQKH